MTAPPIIPTPGGTTYPTIGGAAAGTPGTTSQAAAGSRVSDATGRTKSWLELTHPEFDAWFPKWLFAWEHYTGAVVDPNRVTDYLPRKQLAETTDAYRERTSLADYTPHFANCIDSLAGMLFGVEGDANRIWGETKPSATEGEPDIITGLGDDSDPDTPAGRLADDADGAGSSWLTMWKRLAIQLLVTHRAWVLVDTVDDQARVHILPATSVTNWRYEGGRLVEALVCEASDTRTSIKEGKDFERQWIWYQLGGWSRWRLTKSNKPELATNADGTPSAGTYAYTDRRKKPALPLYLVELPLARPVGYNMAKKANAIYNKESERDALLRNTQLAVKLNVFGEKWVVEEVRSALADGNAALPAGAGPGHNFFAPESGPATVANETLKQKRDEFYNTFFREYGQAARLKTATESKQDLASGAGAILQLLKGAVDDAENEAFWRVEEIELASTPDLWFTARVERSDEFAVEDPNAVIDRLQKRYSPDHIPVGRSAMVDAAKKAAEWDGLEVDDDEIEAAVDLYIIQQQVATAAQLPLGATARAKLAERYCAALNMLGDDEEGPSDEATAILAENKALADAEAKAAVQASSFAFPRAPLPSGAGEGGGPPKPGGKRFTLKGPEGTVKATLEEQAAEGGGAAA